MFLVAEAARSLRAALSFVCAEQACSQSATLISGSLKGVTTGYVLDSQQTGCTS